MTTIELMDLTFNQDLSEFDQHKIVSDLTDKFEPQLLNLLLKSVDKYIEEKNNFLISYYFWDKRYTKYQKTKFTFLGTFDETTLTANEEDEVSKGIPNRLSQELKPLKELQLLVYNLINTNKSNTTASGDDVSSMVEQFLKPLSGYLKQRKIMKEKEYQDLLESTIYLVKNNEPPKQIQPIGRTKLTAEFIRYTFHCLFSHYNIGHNNVLRKKWQLFLHSIFIQFASHGPNTTIKNFSSYPKNYEDVLRSIEYK